MKILIFFTLIFICESTYASTERYIYDESQRLRGVARSIDVHHRFNYDDITNITNKSILNGPDTDLDGITDAEETSQGLNPNNPDENSNGVLDGAEIYI